MFLSFKINLRVLCFEWIFEVFVKEVKQGVVVYGFGKVKEC